VPSDADAPSSVPPPDPLAAELARTARRLGLSVLTVETAGEDDLRDLCRAVVEELGARGLLPLSPEPGCHAARRRSEN
jgi:flavin-dependent dehydrogenase